MVSPSIPRLMLYQLSHCTPQQTGLFLTQGSYRQVCVKFKDFSRTSKRLSYCFQGLKTYEKTGFHVKILLLKCLCPLLKILVLENQCKIMVPLFGAAYAAPNKGTTILY